MAASKVPDSACSHDNEIRVQDCVPTCSQETKQWLSGLVKHKINSTTSNHNIGPKTGVKIQKVPQIILDLKRNDESYDPLVVSIGPYHHGNPKLELMEQHKCRMASNFANDDQGTLEEAYAKVTALAKSARKCYEDDEEGTVAKFNDEEFTKMMFLDGCFVVQFIYCYTRAHNHDDDHDKHDANQDDDQPNSTNLGMKSNIAAWVKRDLFLLENQLPFEVLKNLMMLKFRKSQNEENKENKTNEVKKETWEWETKLGEFIENICGSQHNYSTQPHAKRQDHQPATVLDVEKEPKPAHLLAYTRTKLIGKEKVVDKSTEKKCSSCWSASRIGKSAGKQGGGGRGNWSSYRSAMELKLVGIGFKPSSSRQLTSVEFKRGIFRNELFLPPITVDDSTESLLLNMVAYEACADSPNDFAVTSYICFLDSLIDHAADVKELRSRGILHNFIGSDEQVADIFNEIADNLVPNPDIYADIRENIEKHYKNKVRNWMAEFWHTHFSSPWTILAFLGAIFALILSFIQTFETMFPPGDTTTTTNHTQLNPPHN